MDGLQPVARIGQRALRDGGKRIGEITLGQRLASGSGLMSSFDDFTHVDLVMAD